MVTDDIYDKIDYIETLYKDQQVSDLFNELKDMVGQANLLPAINTKIVCFRCKSVNSPMYLFKRYVGKYIPICYNTDDGGCWKTEVNYNCEYVDHQGIQCESAAEWKICYGHDKTLRTNTCVLHVGIMLTDVDEHTIFPIDQ
jgi:hypothetical protein